MEESETLCIENVLDQPDTMSPMPQELDESQKKGADAGISCLLAVAALIIIPAAYLVLTGLASSNKVRSYADGNDRPIRPSRPLISRTADEVSAAFRSNEIAAADQFRAVRVQISGEIERIAEDYSGRPYVMLVTTRPPGIQCTFPKEARVALASRYITDKVKLVCDFSGKSYNIQFEGCEID